MKKTALLSLILLLVLGGAGWWFWSLGKLPPETFSSITLNPSQGIVEIQHKGQQGWESVTHEVDVNAGDTVRTGDNSDALLTYFGTGESRLDANTQYTVVDAPAQANAQSSIQLRMRLLSGRVWTRLERLLDVKSSFMMQANGIAATVRGTSFDVESTQAGTTVSVTDADVQVKAQQSLVVNEGSQASFDQNGGSVATSTLSAGETQSQWFTQNAKLDSTFMQHAQDAARARLMSLGGFSPDSAFFGFQQMSERAHLALEPTQAPELYSRYAERQLFDMVELVQTGKTGRAFQVMASLNTDIDSHLNGPDAVAYRAALEKNLRDITRVLETADPSSSLYPLKQRVEDLQDDIANQDTNQAQPIYTRLVSIESSLIAADALLDTQSSSTVPELLDAAHLGLENISHDLDKTSGIAAADLDVLQGKLAALRAREAGLRQRLQLGFAQPSSDTQPLPDGSATSTSSTEVLPGATATSTTSTVGVLQSITIVASPNPVVVGSISKLIVTGNYSDGTHLDLTAMARFSPIGTFGIVNGPTFLAQSAGTGVVEARVTNQGTLFTSRVTIVVSAPAVTLVRLDVNPIGQTTLAPGGTLPMRATATYSDGSSKDVTDKTLFKVSDARLGAVTGATFFATQNQIVGSLRITAKYQEGNIHVSGILDLSIR